MWSPPDTVLFLKLVILRIIILLGMHLYFLTAHHKKKYCFNVVWKS